MNSKKLHITSKDSQNLAEGIMRNNQSVITHLYKNNYWKVEDYVIKNSGTAEHAKDVFQEAFVALWRNVKEGKFKELKDKSLEGYLFQIAKNKWIDTLRKMKRKPTLHMNDSMSENLLAEEYDSSLFIENEKQQRLMMEAFNELGEGCKSLLVDFYFKKKSLQTLANELDLQTKSVKNKKYRCMQNLRNIVQQKLIGKNE